MCGRKEGVDLGPAKRTGTSGRPPQAKFEVVRILRRHFSTVAIHAEDVAVS
jgi:hypothetical protein